MLYLEDYLEMIEHLPIELRDRFTEMREIDLGVENTVDSLQERQKQFFASAANMSPTEREEKYQAIRKDYVKVVEDSQEKIQIADDSYAQVDRYLRKLDQELHKFQLELEADNRGITEILEKRSLELDASASRPSNFLKENRPPKKLKTPCHSPSVLGSRVLGPGLVTGGPNTVLPLEQIGASSSAIAQAASQAIAATQLVPGRRSSSLKASYEAINLGVASTEFSIGRELANAAQHALAATSTDISQGGLTPPAYRPQKTNKIKLTKTPGAGPSSLNLSLDMVGGVGGSFLDDVSAADGSSLLSDLASASPLPVMSPSTSLSGQTQGSDQEWNYDPNEPRYCICNQVSYGDMVACDNADCPYEWFHYPCVGVTAPPKVRLAALTCREVITVCSGQVVLSAVSRQHEEEGQEVNSMKKMFCNVLSHEVMKCIVMKYTDILVQDLAS